MKTRKFLWALLPVAAILLMTACGGDDTDDVTPTPTPNPVTPGTENVVESVPYSVTVKTADVTRTSVDGDDTTLRFEATDKLYVQNSNGTIYGCLSLKAGAGQTSATFAGYVNYTGKTPPTNTPLTATLVGSANKLKLIGDDGKVKADDEISIPATPCESMSEAVKKYSWISGNDGTYGTPIFTLKQRTAFMMFNVTIQDGTKGEDSTEGDVSVPVKITNGSETYKLPDQTTTGSQFDAHISFVLPFKEGKKIAANASMCVANVGNDTESILIGTGTDVTLAGGNVYPVTRTKDFVRLWAGGPLWSTRNIGATKVTDVGYFYQWAGTEDVTNSSLVDWKTSPYWVSGDDDHPEVKYSRYVMTTTHWGGTGNIPDGKTEFENYNYIDDAATKNMGSSWRMPTKTDFENLLANTAFAWITNIAGSGDNGAKFTGQGDYEDKSIFLTAKGGSRFSTYFYYMNEDAYYWASSLCTSDSRQAWGLQFKSIGPQLLLNTRRNGHTVRAVRKN